MYKGGVIIIGAGGHAKVVIDLFRSLGTTIVGLTDADDKPRDVLGVPVLGNDAALQGLFEQGARNAFVALGDNARRLDMGLRLQALGFNLLTAVSPRAAVSPSARLGAGVAVMAGAVINAEAEVGDLVIVNSGAVVEHDVVLGRACHIGPGAVLAGQARVGESTLLGAGSSVAPGRQVGANSVIGAGGCVVRDIPADVVAVGVPALVLRHRLEVM